MCHTSKCSWIIHKKWELLCILSWTCISAVVYQPQEILKYMLMHTYFLIYLCTSIIWWLCVYLYIFFTWKKCVKCFIPVGTHSRFTESVQAMQKLHFFCNYSLSTWRCILVKKKKKKRLRVFHFVKRIAVPWQNVGGSLNQFAQAAESRAANRLHYGGVLQALWLAT